MLSCATAAQGQSPPTTAPAPPTAVPETTLTADTIDARLKQVDESTELDDATKAQLREIYQQARTQLAEAAKWQEKLQEFDALARTAPGDLETVKQSLEKPVAAYDLSGVSSRELSVLSQDLTELEHQLERTKQDLVEAEAKVQERPLRRAALPKELADVRAELEKIKTALKAAEADDSQPPQSEARKTLLTATRMALQNRITALEREQAAYEARGDYPRLHVNRLSRLVTQMDDDAKQLRKIVNVRRKVDAAFQAEQAKKDLESAPPGLRSFAGNNLQLAQRRLELAKEIQSLSIESESIEKQLNDWTNDFRRTQNQTSKGTSTTLGLLLRKKRASLPSIRDLRREIGARQATLREMQASLFELSGRDAELANIPTVAKAAADELVWDAAGRSEDELRERLEYLLTNEDLILDNLIDDSNRYFELLGRANTNQESLLAVIEEYASFIDERVFWIRSAFALQPHDVGYAARAVGWLAQLDSWQAVGQVLLADARAHAPLTAVAAVLLLVLIYYKRPVRKSIAELAETASRGTCREFGPTGKALLLTVFAAVSEPFLFGYVGWRLSFSTHAFVQALASGLMAVAVAFVPLELFRQVCRIGGLGQAHFGWPRRGLVLLRSQLRQLVFILLPLIFVVEMFRAQDNELYNNSLGRFCFVALLVWSAWISFRILNPRRGVLVEWINAAPAGGWLHHTRGVWYPATILLPLALAALAVSGYYYTATHLAIRLAASLALIVFLLITGALLYRWVLVKRRRLAMQQAIELRALRQSQDPTAAVMVEDEAADLATINVQTRRLVRSLLVFAAMLGVWWIWVDVLPALSFLEDKELWPITGPNGEPDSVTVGNVLFALLVIIIATVAARNVPGLIEFVLLERLPLESATRYAITTICQYAIALIGILVVCGAIGISWSKAQWLVAALGVGLGFGLQEIFANFVAGIILLFERPIRVGDIVTLGDTTGIVTRIRIRATTIRNWDRQELVVPNKDFITGRLLNWTLTDTTNRIVINVGVAYGSDTRRAHQLLIEILHNHAVVLDDPPPVVTFESFGDSTLNFVIRAYLDGLERRLDTVHELHTTIHDRFAEEGIEIAFPQRDLHIRAIDQSVWPPSHNGAHQRRDSASERPADDVPT